MLRLTPLIFVILITLSVLLPSQPRKAQTNSGIQRLTNTPEEVLNLNPMLSDNGQVLVFESNADLASTGDSASFRAFQKSLPSETSQFVQIARSRAFSSSLSADGQATVFASHEDPLRENPDRNSELFFYDGSKLKQITHTSPENDFSRLTDGNFQPSISGDGRWITFSSTRPEVNNPTRSRAIFLFDVVQEEFIKLTSPEQGFEDTQPKTSMDGSRIFFIRSSIHENTRASLMLHDRKSGETRAVLADVQGLVLGEGRNTSSDGSRIVYSAEISENDSELFIFDLVSATARQLTTLGSRSSDVRLSASISGDGKRITFATRRRVVGASDGSVELYLLDLPTNQIKQVTNAPSSATAEVISSLNFDGSLVAFNFPRILSSPVSSNELANNSEVYLASLEQRPVMGNAIVLNGAAKGNEPNQVTQLAPESIVTVLGNALSFESQEGKISNGQAPAMLGGTTATVQGRPAQLLYVSPTEITIVLPPGLTSGLTEFSIKNSEGFVSKSVASISPTAPGVFTSGGTGRGEAIALNADTLVPSPFDPSDGRLRVLVFATGCRNARAVTASIEGQQLTVESVSRSSTLPGLDEVRLAIPVQLRGLGIATLVITADGIESNPTTLRLSGDSIRDIVINEFLADPADGLAGDANNDGRRDASADEFIELVNSTARDLDITGYRLETRSGDGASVLRHRFAARTVLPAGTAIVIFGGGTPSADDPTFGSSQVVKSSTGSLSLNNTGGTISLLDSSSQLITLITYGGAIGLPANLNQSLTRRPDITGDLVLHSHATSVVTRLFSPGLRADLLPFSPLPAVFRVALTPTAINLEVGQEIQLLARAFDQNDREFQDVIFRWSSSAPGIVEVDQQGRIKAVSKGFAEVVAVARNVSSSPSQVSVVGPTPTPTPSQTPTPQSSPSQTPFPSPSPSPTASASPSPSPSPSFVPIVISEFRTRGPNGANDEFVELYNNSASPVLIGGWKLRGSNNTGGISTRLTINAGTAIPAHGHFLAVNSGYSGAVSGDQTYSSGITNDGGLALTFADDSIIDQVGLSAGSAFREGMHLSPLASDADVSYERRPGGAAGSVQDTNNNFDDFLFITPSQPQNLDSDPVPGPEPTPAPSPSPSAPSPSPSPSPSPLPSPSLLPKMVISQIFGGGGNSGAPFRNDFIEIFNNGHTAVNLDGWSVQYVSATGSTWAVTNLTPVSLDPGQYFLIQEGPTGSNGSELPAPDTIGSITMAATAGKVALVNSRTALSGACPSNQTIIDLVGYGTTASCFSGTGPTTSPSNTTAVIRLADGCVDSQNNSLDFIAGPPTPRNRLSMLNSCSLASIQINCDHGRLPPPMARLFCVWFQISNLQSNYFLSDEKIHPVLWSN